MATGIRVVVKSDRIERELGIKKLTDGDLQQRI
jgi:hypothetical protein